MNAHRRFVVLVIVAAGFSSLGNTAAVDENPWIARVDSVTGEKGYRHGQWGMLVVDKESGSVVFERNADELFCPASVTKLFTTATALNQFGAEYRFETPVVHTGAIDKNGKLDGNLILVARGDLCLGGRTGSDGRCCSRIMIIFTPTAISTRRSSPPILWPVWIIWREKSSGRESSKSPATS